MTSTFPDRAGRTQALTEELIAMSSVTPDDKGCQRRLAELLAPLKVNYPASGEINTKVASMDLVRDKLAGLADKYSNGTVTHIDGVSVEYPDWHFNVRPSNTEPLLRLNLEATTPALMAEKRDEVLAYIRQ